MPSTPAASKFVPTSMHKAFDDYLPALCSTVMQSSCILSCMLLDRLPFMMQTPEPCNCMDRQLQEFLPLYADVQQFIAHNEASEQQAC